MKLKPVRDQVVVITGASSGIGLATARLAAERGAKVFMIARDKDGLLDCTERIAKNGGHAQYAVADVADMSELAAAADTCLAAFGRIDTWVNNAGVGLYGKIEDLPVDDMRRLMDVTFWGVVYGSLVALPHLRENGGALINIGSVESDVALPLNGIYAAAKHAVKAFTQTLRMELEKDRSPVSVTLLKPATIDTPFFLHAKNLTHHEIEAPRPRYAAELVAENILHAAASPTPDLSVGGSAFLYSLFRNLMPRTTEKALEKRMFAEQQGDLLNVQVPGSLHAPSAPIASVRGKYAEQPKTSSVITFALRHRAITSLVTAVSLLGGLSAAVVMTAKR